MIDLEAKVRERLEQKRRVTPCHSNRASSIGHECERYGTYCRTNWEDRTLPDTGLLYIFELGNDFEDIALRRLADAGFKITNQQRDYCHKETMITGHIDGLIVIDGKEYPLEIKSMSPFIWPRVRSAEDMLKSDRPYLRRYPAQLQLYMFLSECEKGVIYLVNKLTGRG